MGEHTTRTLVYLLLVTLLLAMTRASVPLINAPWGKVEGVSVEGDGGRRMSAYLSIPYALPPVGELRFERPLPHPGPGEGQVFQADQPMTACPQTPFMFGTSRETSEDCLKLDVYVPPSTGDLDLDTAAPYAVMIFIHGGAFQWGDAYTYRPSRLVVDGGVIVVVIQYRLGVFGFLTSGDNLLPGNMGLWDQHLAITWVSHNIAAFGGDPGRVTIFGESAGSWSVGLHMVSPKSRGLFHRAVMQSGALQVSVWRGFDEKALFREIADQFPCQGESTEALLACMKDQPMGEFLNKTNEVAGRALHNTYFYPRVDGEFVVKNPMELAGDERYMTENGVDKVDVMMGMTNKEGGTVPLYAEMMGRPRDFVYTGEMFQETMSMCLTLRRLRNNAVLRKFLEFYYRGAESGRSVSGSLDGLVNLLGDCALTADIFHWAKALASSCHSAARKVYVLDHDFDFNKDGIVTGSHHADDLVLEFDTSMFVVADSIFVTINKSRLADDELPLADKFIQILTTFAKTGDPSPAVTKDLGVGQAWPQFTGDTQTYLSLAPTASLVHDLGPYADRVFLWTTFLPDLNATTAHLPLITPQSTHEDDTSTREEL